MWQNALWWWFIRDLPLILFLPAMLGRCYGQVGMNSVYRKTISSSFLVSGFVIAKWHSTSGLVANSSVETEFWAIALCVYHITLTGWQQWETQRTTVHASLTVFTVSNQLQDLSKHTLRNDLMIFTTRGSWRMKIWRARCDFVTGNGKFPETDTYFHTGRN